MSIPTVNRKERRSLVKGGITAEGIKQLTQQEGIYATRYAVHGYSVAFATVLRDKLHFGNTKLIQTIKQVEDLFDSINSGYLSIEDLEQTLSEEAGIVIRERQNDVQPHKKRL
jgi:hypothetical protein